MRSHEMKIWNPETETMDREKLRALQGERLKATVRRVYDNVPVYRKRMDDKGITPGDIRCIDDLKHLPFTDKADLRDQFPYGLFAEPLKNIVRIQGSSGTTGMPVVAGYTKADIDIWTEGMARTMTAAGGASTTSFRWPTATACSPAAWAPTRAPPRWAPPSSPCPAATPRARSR